MVRRIWLCIVGIAIALESSFVLEAGEPTGPLIGFASKRTWVDTTGKHQIEGSMKSADAKAIQILKTDGKIVTVPLEKMSEKDKAFVEGFLAAEKALMKSGGDQGDNPFAGGVAADPSDLKMPKSPDRSPKGSSSSGDLSSASKGTLEKRNAITNGFKPFPITPSKAFWSVKPPLPFPDVTFEETVINTELPKPFFAGMSLVAAGKLGTVVASSYQQGNRGRDSQEFSKFVVINISTAEASAPIEFAQPWKIMTVSSDGKRIAAVRVEGFDKGNDVAIFSVTDGQLVPEFEFTAGGGAWDELHWAAFLPKNRLATISQKHNITFWDLANPSGPKALLRSSTGGSLSAELTAAGELIAMPMGKLIAVVDTNDGKLVGTINRDQPANDIAFSPDATMLAAFHPFTVTLYGLADGKEIRTIAVSDGNPGANIRWLGKHLMVGSILYDVERGVPLWTYENGSNAQASLGNYLISGFGGEKGSPVVVNRIPHDEALRSAKEIDPQTAYAIKPGTPISVQYDFGPTPQNYQAEIQKAVEEKIKTIGWKLEDSASIVIKIKMEQGKQQEAEYYTRHGPPFFAPPGFGPRPSGPSEKVSYQSWTHTLTIAASDKQLFHSSFVRGAPDNLQTKDGESTQAAVTRICQPTPSYFSGLSLPPYLLKPEFQGGLGKSKVSGEGLR